MTAGGLVPPERSKSAPLAGGTKTKRRRCIQKLTHQVYQVGDSGSQGDSASHGSAETEPKVRNFLTLCLSGHQEKAREAIPQFTKLGWYQTGEKEDTQHPGIWRFFFSIRSEDVKR